MFVIRLLQVAMALLMLIYPMPSADETAPEPVDAGAFSIDLICRSEDVYQIFYTYYIDGQSCGIGALADLDGGMLTPESELTLTFPVGLFEAGADVSRFSIDFSPYGQGDIYELGTTNQVYINAEYGGHYTIELTGSAAEGFTAELIE